MGSTRGCDQGASLANQSSWLAMIGPWPQPLVMSHTSLTRPLINRAMSSVQCQGVSRGLAFNGPIYENWWNKDSEGKFAIRVANATLNSTLQFTRQRAGDDGTTGLCNGREIDYVTRVVIIEA